MTVKAMTRSIDKFNTLEEIEREIERLKAVLEKEDNYIVIAEIKSRIEALERKKKALMSFSAKKPTFTLYLPIKQKEGS